MFVYTSSIMNYIVFDLEWNQCPDGKEFEEKSLPFEILEIGAVKLNHEYCETGRFSERIRPSVYRTLHYHIQEILHLNLKSLKKCRTFPEVFLDFMSWCGEDAVFCTWGPLDLYELQRNMRYYGITSPFPRPLRYYDIQKIFSIVYEDRKTRRSLEYAADYLQLPRCMPFHSAQNDAVYTADIMKTLPRETVSAKDSIDYFQNPKNRKDEIYTVYDTHSKFISREFPSKIDAMKDWKVTSTRCYLCRKNARRKIRWFSNGNGTYFSLSYCEDHGWLQGRIRIKKTEEGNFFCIKTLQLIRPEEAEELRAKREAMRNKRKK